MQRIPKSLLRASALMALLLLAGCGPVIPTGTSGLSPTPTMKPPPSPATTGTPTPTPAFRAGPITLHTDALLYQTSDTITVTLSNQSDQTIYFPDHLTNCTVILLQRSNAQPLADGGGPGGINPCRMEIVTRIHSLGPGQHLVVKLVAPRSGWPTGLYIATLSYRRSPSIGPSTPLSSPAFAVGPRAPQP